MLNKKTLIEKLGEEYKPMINKISIPDFTKCIAQYSGIEIQYVKDEIIEEYLIKWARNKKHFFDLFEDIRVDMPIHYVDESKDFGARLTELAKNYPIFFPWLRIFREQVQNKINGDNLYWQDRDLINEVFPGYRIDGTTMTHFFKDKLNAPDELVTAIGRVFENTTIDATYTLSIDPVDIMLSSENPYNWTSCYRLENFYESHADGCLAGVLDYDTVISYIWTSEGKFSLYDKYEFKNIKYKRVRITLAINRTFNAIHFNATYPWKESTSSDFKKMIREKVENYISDKTGQTNLWRKYTYQDDLCPYRRYDCYGYGEYDGDYVWVIKDSKKMAPFEIYNEEITCPCGCGNKYRGSNYDDYDEYNGDGHINENWYENECEEEEWCDCANEYVTCDHNCEECPDYNRYNAVCSLDTSHNCNDRDLWEAEDEGDADWYRSNVVKCNPEHCQGCPLYKIHHPEENSEEEKEENNEEQTDMVTLVTGVDTDGNILTITSPFPSHIENQYYNYYTNPEVPNNLRVEVDEHRWRQIPGEWYNDNDNN